MKDLDLMTFGYDGPGSRVSRTGARGDQPYKMPALEMTVTFVESDVHHEEQ